MSDLSSNEKLELAMKRSKNLQAWKAQTILNYLLNSWGFYKENKSGWNINNNYIFNILIPNVMKKNYEGLTPEEVEAFSALKNKLTSSEWNNLAYLINSSINKKIFVSEKEKQLEAEEKARLEAEEKARLNEKEAIKKSQMEDLVKCFEVNFLNSDTVYKNQFSMLFSKEEFEEEKIRYVRKWIKKHTGNDIDNEQARAVGSFGNNIQVVARAGSGKTSTIVNRTIFLHKHLGISGSQIILVAFNKKAAEEIEQRLAKYFENKPPIVATFHALAYRNVNPKETIISDGNGQSAVVQKIIDDHLQNDKYEKELRKIMLAHFKNELDVIEGGKFDKPKEEFLEYRRSLTYQTLNNDYVKSKGEKEIANFLFEHNLNYDYEKGLYWKGTPYHPDFTLLLKNGRKVIIEYFGLTNNTMYDWERKEKINYWKSHEEYFFIEIYPGETDENNLKLKLEKVGVKGIRLSEDEIWKRVRARAIDRFSNVTKTFITRCRQLIINPSDLEVDSRLGLLENDLYFIKVMQKIYEAYLNYLSINDLEDFSGLLIRAISSIKEDQMLLMKKGEVIGDLNKIKYLFVDEYQDLSKSFFELINAIKSKNKFVELFCVGDDWQAINMFAGSDLRYYKDFDKYFKNSIRLSISTNYRSTDSIVRLSNELMKKEEGTPAVCNADISGNVLLADFGDAPLSIEESSLNIDKITSIALRLIKNTLDNDKEIVFLLRNNRIPYSSNDDSSPITFRNKIRSYFPESKYEHINISTIHSYKGKESDVVVVLDLRHNSYPFIHPDFRFNIMFGDSFKKLIDEERRLFYVALTRPINTLILLAEDIDDPSPFLEEIINHVTIKKLDWKNFPQTELVDKANYRVIFSEMTFGIKDELRSERYTYDSSEKSWWKNFSVEDYSLDALKEKLEKFININKAKNNFINLEIIRGNEVETNKIQSGKWGIWINRRK